MNKKENVIIEFIVTLLIINVIAILADVSGAGLLISAFYSIFFYYAYKETSYPDKDNWSSLD